MPCADPGGSLLLSTLSARAQVAVVAVAGDPGHLNPAISTAGPLHAVADSIFNGLVALDRDGNAQPDLATSLDASRLTGAKSASRCLPG